MTRPENPSAVAWRLEVEDFEAKPEKAEGCLVRRVIAPEGHTAYHFCPHGWPRHGGAANRRRRTVDGGNSLL
ncbi:hypothetical protein ACVCAH_31290 [Micromonospora sp. LZ34]